MIPDMPLTFDVVQFHFTSPAEHYIGDSRADLEMQLVFKINQEYLPNEIELTTRRVIVSFLFQVDVGANNTFVNSLNMNTLGYIPELLIEEFIGNVPDKFVFYNGSLSYPNCNENVYRFIYITTQYISNEQLRHFTQYHRGNARILQDINGRDILKVTKSLYSYGINLRMSVSIVILLMFIL